MQEQMDGWIQIIDTEIRDTFGNLQNFSIHFYFSNLVQTMDSFLCEIPKFSRQRRNPDLVLQSWTVAFAVSANVTMLNININT